MATLLAVLVFAIPVASNAQETSSAIRGIVTDDNGNPLAGVTATVRNEDSGLTRTAVTNESGVFNVRNLPIDENYSVAVSSEGFGGERAEGLSVDLGKTTEVNFALSFGAEIEEVVVLGTRDIVSQTAVGPSASFGLAELQNAPAINRNITDVIRADPRVYVDESRGGINAVQCGGKNSRFNSLTVDGVRMNDSFGLNANGYPTERMPFSYDVIQQVAVELAPFDVEYGGFSACNINAVTKSGGNSFSGSVFYDFTNNDLRADSLEGDSISTGSYDEERYGLTFGGPIVQDKLFFFAAYEKLEGANLFDRGPQGSGAVNEIDIEQAELDRIVNIAQTLYQYDPGAIPSSRPHEDEKLLLKLDWNLSDTQRVAFTYNYNDGFNWSESDSDQNEFEFENHLYERGAELNSYVGSLYSDWSDVFSTELRVSYLELDNRQNSVGGSDFGEIRIETDDVDVYIGGDDSRQSNVLSYDVMSIALKGNYYLGDHSLTFGVETEVLDIFNLFVQHTSTEIRFDGIDNFEAGLADAIYYNNAPSHNPVDAAADWGYDFNTAYIQDEFAATDTLNIVFGVRYDWYTTSDEPPVNPDFLADYGFGNNNTTDGLDLLQPRFGFTWDVTPDTTLRGGVGLYSGGNPNVWLSNSYSANNVLQFGQRGRSFCYTPDWNDPDEDWFDFCTANFTEQRSLLTDPTTVYVPNAAGVPDGPGWGVPQDLYDAVSTGVGDNFEINYLDPNFKLPSEWKFALGVTHNFPGDYLVNADILVTRGRHSLLILHGDLDQVGTDPDGYPIYDDPREASFVLTNSSTGNRSTVVSLGLQKSIGDSFDYRIGYSYTDAEDVQPMTSSVAFSNYTNRAFFDPQEDILSTSNYQIKNRITAAANWYRDIGSNMLLTVSLYGQANSGRPYSFAFNGTADPYGFTPFLDFADNVLEPGDARNGEEGSWWRKLDLRVNLDFPGFGDGHEASAFLVIDNLSNLLNDDWGVLRQHNFPRTVARGTEEPRIGDASRYEIRFGVRYSFE
ncbi:MAG: TonB-dependent receptor [Woeseiaceae bacterium]|nr:TonB-dependent receptor [Woeseiaceae bacterium]